MLFPGQHTGASAGHQRASPAGDDESVGLSAATLYCDETLRAELAVRGNLRFNGFTGRQFGDGEKKLLRLIGASKSYNNARSPRAEAWRAVAAVSRRRFF
jgi:hypothetical protein